jgi:A/G-specific adenine glycosylase
LFRRRLLAWYDRNRRDLPWRGESDPYRVWVSEVMLQQTRVAAVIDYYQRFLKRFPSVEALANARLPKVLTAWSGLGYYRRARMLHASAQVIVKERKSVFPQTAGQWREFPGIGRYTAAAIASIACDEPVAVVDGNVERVLSRIHGRALKGEEVWQKAGEVLSPNRPGDFNQAMMELGATVCLPAQPKCQECPVSAGCATRGPLAVARPEVRRKQDVTYALACRARAVFLVKRPRSASLMAGMWELPEVQNGNGGHSLKLRHSITVTDYTVHVLRQGPPSGLRGSWVGYSRLPDIPLTGLTRKILRAAGII